MALRIFLVFSGGGAYRYCGGLGDISSKESISTNIYSFLNE